MAFLGVLFALGASLGWRLVHPLWEFAFRVIFWVVYLFFYFHLFFSIFWSFLSSKSLKVLLFRGLRQFGQNLKDFCDMLVAFEFDLSKRNHRSEDYQVWSVKFGFRHFRQSKIMTSNSLKIFCSGMTIVASWSTRTMNDTSCMNNFEQSLDRPTLMTTKTYLPHGRSFTKQAPFCWSTSSSSKREPKNLKTNYKPFFFFQETIWTWPQNHQKHVKNSFKQHRLQEFPIAPMNRSSQDFSKTNRRPPEGLECLAVPMLRTRCWLSENPLTSLGSSTNISSSIYPVRVISSL